MQKKISIENKNRSNIIKFVGKKKFKKKKYFKRKKIK